VLKTIRRQEMERARVEERAASLVWGMGTLEYLRSRAVLHRLLVQDEASSLGRELSQEEKDAIQSILSTAALAARS
jgi:hypothetical protein